MKKNNKGIRFVTLVVLTLLSYSNAPESSFQLSVFVSIESIVNVYM